MFGFPISLIVLVSYVVFLYSLDGDICTWSYSIPCFARIFCNLMGVNIYNYYLFASMFTISVLHEISASLGVTKFAALP